LLEGQAEKENVFSCFSGNSSGARQTLKKLAELFHDFFWVQKSGEQKSSIFKGSTLLVIVVF
jgi:hypothetical protein